MIHDAGYKIKDAGWSLMHDTGYKIQDTRME